MGQNWKSLPQEARQVWRVGAKKIAKHAQTGLVTIAVVAEQSAPGLNFGYENLRPVFFLPYNTYIRFQIYKDLELKDKTR